MAKGSSSSVRVFFPKFSTQTLVAALREKMSKLSQTLPLKLVALFGSYAKGNYTVASDIDLLVIYKGNSRKDAYSQVKQVVDIPQLEPHVYSEAEFAQMRPTIERMIRVGKIIFQEEQKG